MTEMAQEDQAAIAMLARRLLSEGATDIHEKVTLLVQRAILTAAMNHTCGNQAKAAKLLGIGRFTLRSKLARLGLRTHWQINSGDAGR